MKEPDVPQRIRVFLWGCGGRLFCEGNLTRLATALTVFEDP